MPRKSPLLTVALGAFLASVALALPHAKRTATIDDPIACPYCGGGATLETLAADLSLRIGARTGKLFLGF